MVWYEQPLLGSEVLVWELLVSLGILLLGFILAYIFPKRIAANIRAFYVKLEKKSLDKDKSLKGEEVDDRVKKESRRLKKTLEAPLRKGLVITYIILFLGLAIYALDIELQTSFEIFGNDYQVWRFLLWILEFTFFLTFSILAIDPLLRASIYALYGSRIKKSRKYGLYRKLRFPTKGFFIVFGSYLAFVTTFNREQMINESVLTRIHLFLMLILFTWVFAYTIVTLTEPYVSPPGKKGRQTGRAIGRLIRVMIFIVGGLVGMMVLGLDPITIATSLGLIGFALAFGLQDTVANFAAGIMITVDRPFVIGDRIKIHWGGQDTWGDVTDISLRSTWIRTPEGEMIVIPNNVIATSQVWNFTRDSPKIALKVDVGISYDSDWKLAEKVILKLLKKHPLVLNKPHPYVLIKEFGDSSQVLTVWFWIPEARDKLIIQSDVLKRIKDAFDSNGIEIPFPYRTLVNKTDLERPKHLTEPYTSPMYLPSTGYRKVSIAEDKTVELESEASTILAPTSAPYAAKFTAPYVMETARKMKASVTALYILSTGGDINQGQRALRIYNQVAKAYGVDIKLKFKSGDVLEKILQTVEEENATLVIMGSTEESMFGSITRKSVSQEVLSHLNIPTMVIPFRKESEEKYQKVKRLSVETEHPEAAPKVETEEPEDYTALGALEKMSEEGQKKTHRGMFRGFLRR